MEDLEVRQQNIIKQLEELQQQIQIMNKDLNVCSKPAQSVKSNVSTQTSEKPQPIDVKLFVYLII